MKCQKRYWITFTILCLLFVTVLFGCKKKKEEQEVIITKISGEELILTPTRIPTLSPTPTLTPTPDPTPEGMEKSVLTGEWIPKEVANRRPYAVMLNNIKVASPQSGTQDADILYEILVEAGITRLMAIYQTIDPESKTAKRLGSVRSARHYFASIASEYDAIFVHFGQTTYATKKMDKLKMDRVNGLTGYGVSSFYRDKSIKAPHNAFASLSGIEKAVEKAKYRTERKEGYTGQFTFYNEEQTLQNGQTANQVTLPFSSGMQPYLVYDPETRLYTRYQFGKVHVDYNTDQALKFKNIIIQIVKQWDIDKNGYQTMDLENTSGEGYYITNGTAIPIKWTKKESSYFMRYYDEKQEVLTINPGKTYIAVFPDFRASKIEFE